jgi:hypothetical protein
MSKDKYSFAFFGSVLCVTNINTGNVDIINMKLCCQVKTVHPGLLLNFGDSTISLNIEPSKGLITSLINAMNR